ncbi:glycosyltransferase family 90 protein [Bipolaris maydis ATCC 48331]|uniref:Glycosyltransferase family 90 protein n=2 Tax=Cochliobolus heterostrophus TaxID=5016 RepID=M2UFQ9_COCH5|nr:glycosyltransferase family 90 protein [Bipolaris maydis ATCC 48331]EMD86818.1 glycosyltransferase family 90 protein [Bipolaris maydis C5]KAJ6203619.1 glycosyltransferase family 90 protein [Bipolaris maydis]ENI03206.1 glycosyltransferase family 90 protein [Bipolaris maydis ATCC 48331]KAJ6267285.1 glycosyltransferase [Bipolaris maydis]KAJ6267755.1 glycosyltransferase [Bipolaris maydis]
MALDTTPCHQRPICPEPHLAMSLHLPVLCCCHLNPYHRMIIDHPVEIRIRKAQEEFELLVSRQSKTLESAKIEYQRRYSRDPPPGFDEWFFYAKSKHSVLIDDFDMINEGLSQLWKVDPNHLHKNIDYASKSEHLALRICGFRNGQYYMQENHWLAKDLGNLLNEVSQDIPDVEFLINLLDEPRIIPKPPMLDTSGISEPQFIEASHSSIWNHTVSLCAHISPNQNACSTYDSRLSLVGDWSKEKDVCLHPEFALTHGFFLSPMTAILTNTHLPILSQAAPSSFGDIVYPSPWYTDKMDQGEYDDEKDPLWDQKARKLYWAGSTTGSYSWNGTWRYSHRQRFVELVQNLNKTHHVYLQELKPRHWVSYRAIEEHGSLFDVKFTDIIQCDIWDCEAQNQFFIVSKREARTRQLSAQFAFDTDGNSFSGRFYTLLQSRSVVLKQTVFREWHDERVVPWVHFVPVSLSMNELPEIMRYMTAHEQGKKRAQEIAEAGREWHGKALRKEDFTIYLYRLMLELARVMGPTRQVRS